MIVEVIIEIMLVTIHIVLASLCIGGAVMLFKSKRYYWFGASIVAAFLNLLSIVDKWFKY